MTRSRLVLNSSVIATAAATGFLMAAAVSNTTAGDAMQKGDRFAVVGDELCGNQAWPNITAECVAWKNGAPEGADKVRYVTVQNTDAGAGVTELTRIAVPQ